MFKSIWKAVAWLGGHELVVLLGLLVIVAGAWGFIELGDWVQEGRAPAFDTWLLKALRRSDDPAVPIAPPWVTESMRDITALGGATVLMLVTGTVCGFLWFDRKFSALWFVLSATVIGFLLSEGLKALYGRPRPTVVPYLSPVHSWSFPSGHSMMSAVVYLTLGTLLARLVAKRWLKFYLMSVAVVLTGLVGASRVYMGVHYPTDVLAGWAAGLGWAAACWLVARWLQHRGAIEARL